MSSLYPLGSVHSSDISSDSILSEGYPWTTEAIPSADRLPSAAYVSWGLERTKIAMELTTDICNTHRGVILPRTPPCSYLLRTAINWLTAMVRVTSSSKGYSEHKLGKEQRSFLGIGYLL